VGVVGILLLRAFLVVPPIAVFSGGRVATLGYVKGPMSFVWRRRNLRRKTVVDDK